MKYLLLFVFSIACCLLSTAYCLSQGCCSGGSGSPIAGGASVGVLLDRQMEIGYNLQYINGNKFLAKDMDTAALFDNFNSKYSYSRIAYGVTKDFTLSVESGYFINKTQTGLFDSTINKSEIIRSSGIGDLIIFPRYDVLNHTEETKRTEITLGIGYKIPLGKHDDSTLVYTDPSTGQQTFTTSPPLVQPTSGSQDIILYAFFFRGFPLKNFKVFATTTYIRKGWNSLGQKFGDYAHVCLFAGKTFLKSFGVTLQVKGELIDKMPFDKNADMLALYNIDVNSTGSKKVSFVPQISYTYKSWTIFSLIEIPLYEYANGAQLAKLHPFTAGLSYRFFTARNIVPKNGETIYECPMKCERSASAEPGKCNVCGMDLIKQR